MYEKKIHILLILVLISVNFVFAKATYDEGDRPERVRIVKGFDYDTTFVLVDDVTGAMIYDAWHNILRLEAIIDGNHVFIEDIVTEECSDWIVVSNPADSLLMRAYNLGWCFDLDEQDLELLKGADRPFHVESLDIENRRVDVRFFNDSIATLELYGELYGKYYVEYDVRQTDIIADTVWLSPEEAVLVMNNYVYLEVHYEGRVLYDGVIWPDSFKGIDNPERYILAPTDKVWFEVSGDVLKVSTGMYMNDTDCGYNTEITITPDGDMFFWYIENESLLGFDQCMDQVKTLVPLSELGFRTVIMDFYNEQSSSREEYALLFYHYLEDKDESASEGIAYKVYEMLTMYPEKIKELDAYLSCLSRDHVGYIKKRIAADLAFEHYARFAGSDKMSVDDFVSTFPYFNDPYYIEIYIQTVDNYL